MPGRDGTGPIGNSRVFGRRMGYCHVVSPASIIGCGLGLGLGLGLGFRGGRNPVAFEPTARVSQKELLEEQKQVLETRLSFLSKQLENIKEE